MSTIRIEVGRGGSSLEPVRQDSQSLRERCQQVVDCCLRAPESESHSSTSEPPLICWVCFGMVFVGAVSVVVWKALEGDPYNPYH